MIPIHKKFDAAQNAEIFRPICVYSDLKTKIILALTYKYLLYVLNDLFHGNMLFMRSAVKDRSGRRATPNYTHAIDLASRFRADHDGQDIYVGECDIQKFYDIINHTVILDCLDRLLELKAEQRGVDIGLFAPARNIVVQYLESFNYYDDVWKKNDQGNRIWSRPRKQYRKNDGSYPKCMFGWVSDAKFIESGCYDAESLEQAKTGGLLGIPQGGALSGIIVNVIMQSIDYDIVSPKDPDRLFVRFCDDILLMHTNMDKCREYLDIYLANLKSHKLVPHPMRSVSEFKNGERTHKEFWDAKSKRVFKWGSGSGDASDWIAFVGYEMRRTGEIRLRKDKIDEQFKKIAHKYFQVINLGAGLQEKLEIEGMSDYVRMELEKRLEGFNQLAPKMNEIEKTTRDRYSAAQGRHIDKYLKMKVRRAANKLKIAYPDHLELFETAMS